MASYLHQEIADKILLETGDGLLLELSEASSSSSSSLSSSSSSSSRSSSSSSSSNAIPTDAVYTRGDYAALPANDDALETAFGGSEYEDVAVDDGTRVLQTMIGEHGIFQFKDDDPAANSNVRLKWNGQSSLAPSSSTVYLQIYNRDTPAWESIASDSTTGADTDFDLDADVNDLTDYKDVDGWISCRVYQDSS